MAISRVTGIAEAELRRILGFWMWRFPPEYLEDGLQDMAVGILDMASPTPVQVWKLCRDMRRATWQKYQIRSHYSLDAENADGHRMAEYIVSGVDYEARVCHRLDASALFRSLPKWIQGIVSRRLTGEHQAPAKYRALNTWALAHAGQILASYMQ
jgi:hypothetical protein